VVDLVVAAQRVVHPVMVTATIVVVAMADPVIKI